MPKNDKELDKSQPKADKAKAVDSKPSVIETKTKLAPKSDPVSVVKAATVKSDMNPAKSSSAAKTSSMTSESDSSVAVKQAVGTSVMTRAADAAKGMNTREARSVVIKVASVVVALLAVIVIVFGVLIYGYKSESPVVKAVAQVVPYPAERVNNSFVSYSDYLFEVDANERAYQNNAKLNNQPAVDFNSAAGKKLVTQIKQQSLTTLESDTLVAQLAAQKHVTVSDKDVNDLINQLYSRYGGKDTLLKTLNQIYGWNLSDLHKVVYKQLLAKDLQDKVTSDPAVDAAAKAKAEDVLKQIQAGGDFGTLAKKYSQASDAASGGDLGYFTKGQLPDNEQTAAEALQPGEVSDVIKTQYGYEIIKVLDKKDDGSIHAQHILIKTIDFNSWFQDQLKQAKVSKYITA